MIKYIFPDIFSVFLFLRKITAVIIHHHTISKNQLQVFIQKPVQIHLAHMEHPIGALQPGRSEHFPHRDIYICHTIFKSRLSGSILNGMKGHSQVRPICILSLNMHLIPLIHGLDNRLLYLLIDFSIQGINPNHFPENLRKLPANFRHRPGNNGKTALFSFDIAVGNL